MKKSIINGAQLPETESEYQQLKAAHKLRHDVCIDCNSPFDHSVVFTPEGWRETQITGYCEQCFDGLFGGAEG